VARRRPALRVVVDLDKACKFRAGTRRDNKIIVKLYTGSMTAQQRRRSQ